MTVVFQSVIFSPLLVCFAFTAWFPRLETDDRHVVQEMEDGLQRELERLRHYPFPKFVGEQVPDEEVKKGFSVGGERGSGGGFRRWMGETLCRKLLS